MRKTIIFALCLFLVVFAGCNSDDSEKKNPTPATSGANIPVAPTPDKNLLAIQGSCKLGSIGPEDSAAGTVKMEIPKKGEFTACGVLPPNREGMVAFQARAITGAPGRPTLRVIGPGKPGSSECVTAQPTGVNYIPDLTDPASVVYVTKGINNSTCKVETSIYDAHHWKGKLTANLLPAKPEQGSTIVPIKAEWDLYF